MKRILTFLQEVEKELRKVNWPTKKELTQYTITVVLTVMFMSIFFVVVDYLISVLIRWYL